MGLRLNRPSHDARTPNLALRGTTDEGANTNSTIIDEFAGDVATGRYGGIGLSAAAFGIIGDGTTDQTTALAAAATTAAGLGRPLYLPPGVYIVDGLTLPTAGSLIGAGPKHTTIKRKANAVDANGTINISGRIGVTIADLTVDGNAAVQTVAAHNLRFSNSPGATIRNVASIASFAGGITIVDDSLSTLGSRTTVIDCEVSDSTGAGITIQRSWAVEIRGCLVGSNGTYGVVVINFAFPPTADEQNHLLIVDNQIYNNGNMGLYLYGYTMGGSGAAPLYGPGLPPTKYFVVRGNRINTHPGTIGPYALGIQGGAGVVAGNVISGSASTAGVLFNAIDTTFEGNVIDTTAPWGLDAGGSFNCAIVGNTITGIAGTNCVGINAGGGAGTVVANNAIRGFSGATSGVGIDVLGQEGDGSSDGAYPYVGTRTLITGNSIEVANAAHIGIWIRNLATNCVVSGNLIVGTSVNTAIVAAVGTSAGSGIAITANLFASGETVVPSIASAATLVIPDYGDTFFVTGTTGITNIRTHSDNAFFQRVRDVSITNPGSGYTSPPTLSFSGGGGSGAAGTVHIDGAGSVRRIIITNTGSGYTSAPTPAFAGGGGSGAVGTAILGAPNFDGRRITLIFGAAVTVTDGGNLELNGNFTSAGANDTLSLVGYLGKWYETGRSVN